MPTGNDDLITGVDVRGFFQSAVAGALERQSIAVQEETAIYLVNLLTTYVRAETLYDRTPEGVRLLPLAEIYGHAVNASSLEDRDRALQRLGDLALFISGLFADSLSRSLVDIDYYIAMGGNAYGCLAGSGRRGWARTALRQVFSELAGRFPDMVEVLAEVGDNANLRHSCDVLRLYEIWLSTGSRRAAVKLRRLGIDPVSTRRLTH